MTVTLKITDGLDGSVRIDIEGEHTCPNTRAKRISQLIVPVIQREYPTLRVKRRRREIIEVGA